MTTTTCRSCGGTIHPLFSFGRQPVVNRLQLSPTTDYLAGPMSHGVCHSCALLQNTSPMDPAVFYENYDTPSSWKPEPHLPRLIAEMQKRVAVHHKILDVGCNDGSFMSALTQAGFQNITGLEPSTNTAAAARANGHAVWSGYFSTEVARDIRDRLGLIDVIVSRQVLEHVSDPNEFLQAARLTLAAEGMIVLEVPDSTINISEGDFSLWDEHINFFTEATLTRLLRRHNFEVVLAYKSLFSGRCLTIFAVLKSREAFGAVSTSEDVSQEVHAVKGMVPTYFALRQSLHRELASIAEEREIILLGVGSRSCTQVNLLDLGSYITHYSDDNPSKQGRWVPGTQFCIRPLRDTVACGIQRPFILLGVNAETEHKVIEKLRLTPGVDCASILPPSHFLLDSWASVYSPKNELGK